ncbi:hypothetical protein STEG23_021471 [Scotinomys teguina]
MEDLDQSPLVSSSADSPPRPPPSFQYQFVKEPEDEEDEDEEDEEEDLEELEVLERKPAVGLSAAPVPPATVAPLLDFGSDSVPPAPRGPLPSAPPAAPERQSSWERSPTVPAPSLSATAAVLPSKLPEDDEPPARPPPPPPAGASPLAEPAAPPSTPAAPKRRGSGSVEHEYLGNLSAVSSTEGTIGETLSEASKELPERATNPFVDRDLTEFSELEYSEMGSSFTGCPKAESTILVENTKEEVTVTSKDKEDLVSSAAHHNPQELPMTLTKVVKEDRVMAPEKTKDIFNEMQVSVVAPMREEYADFKPFEQEWEVKDTYEGTRDVLARVDKNCFEDNLERKSNGKDSESSIDDASIPTTPEPVKDGSRAYITCASFTAASDSIAANIFPLLEDHTSENKTDEKKIEERKAQIITEKTSPKTSNPFLVATQDSEADYVTTGNLSKVTEVEVANVAEGLTPDLVQEACESELNEVTGTKIAYETKMDLVQTSGAVQESLYPTAQLCPSFEDSEATPSPVLPDIVMEAPLNSLLPNAGASLVQPSVSPLETPQSVSYDSIKLEPENPPAYEEAMKVAVKASGAKEEVKEPASVTAAVQETEAPYISIACDLIKETQLSTEPSPELSNYSEIAKFEKLVPDHSELVEDSSPDSEPVDLFSDDSIPEVPQTQEEAVMLMTESLTEVSETVTQHKHKDRLSVSPQEVGKPYLESFQPNLHITKDPAPNEILTLTKKEKIPLQMEELNTAIYSNDDLLASKEDKIKESETFSDSSPIEIIDEFPTFVSSKTDSSKLAKEYTDLTDLEASKKSEIANVQSGAGSLPCSELPHDLSFKNIHPKDEVRVSDEFSKDRSNVSKVSLLSSDVSALGPQTEMGSIVKPKVLMKEAEKKRLSDTEKEDKSLSAVFSSELSKTSVVDLLYWRDIKKTGVVFGASLFLLLSLTVFSIVSVTAYIALALLSVTISFRIYKGVIQAIQKSDEGHPFRAYLESEVAVSEELVQKYSNSALGHVNSTIKELRRLFLVDDLVDSLKFAVLMWVFTYVGALFNGLTLLILALISLFSIPVIYERHQAQIDHYLGLANKNVKEAMAKIQAKIPGLKRKAE